MAAKKKIIASVAAVATSAALLLGGTMAWQSANQVALNEASDVINPGGRLHDDFNGENKDVYVENFTDPEAGGENIFARVRLEEYFEIITNYTEDGAAPEKVHTIVGKQMSTSDFDSLDGLNVRYAVNEDGTAGEALYVRDYDIHVFTEEELNDAAVKTEDDGTSYAWWNWQLGGETIYMPTYNLNKDSLLADVNGVFDGAVGTITDKNPADPYAQYQDENFPYVEYTENEEAYGYEVYDGDTNDADKIQDSVALKGIIEDGEGAIPAGSEGAVALTDEEVPHYAKSTLKAELISMEDWLQMLEDNGGYDASLGNYWVYDEDGWVYWSAPIEPGTATGLLLDGIELNQVMDDTWYYAINVVAQFITADDMGKTNGTGFYDKDMGYEPTTNALTLLKTIGVEVPITTQAELQAAFEQGGTITLPDVEITSDEATDPGNLGFTSDYSWTKGGTLNGGELVSTIGSSHTLFINNEINWPVAGDDANAATMNGTDITSGSRFAIYAQAVDAPITLNAMNITNNHGGGILAEYTYPITLNNLTVYSASLDDDYEWVNSALAAGMGANVEINGGSYTGKNAVYLLSSGANVTINDGTFTGALTVEKGTLTIYGGTFDHDPSAYVAEGYEAVKDEEAGTWTVQADTSDKAAPSVSITNASTFNQIISISDVSDEDFPLTVNMYQLDSEEANYAATPAMTITIKKAGDGIDYTATEELTTNHTLRDVTMSNGIIAIDYNLAPGESCYLHAVVKDASGNESSANMFVPAAVGCFAAGTQVLTEEGLKNIEDITLGELVWSVNMETYQSELKPVTYVQGERYIDATYTLYVGGEKIVTTYEHPFYANGEWTAAEDLKAGDMLRRMNGTEVAIDKVVYTELAEPLRVYNFTVDENHCYIVSAEQLLVHNVQK